MQALTVNYQLSRASTGASPLPTLNRSRAPDARTTTLNYQLSTTNYQLPITNYKKNDSPTFNTLDSSLVTDYYGCDRGCWSPRNCLSHGS
ncbi:MAG: hypothetical protein ACRC62_23995 [Microcoleus sp.]